ncbi:MAG TPA: sensor histidine kinase [Chitinophagaceae bacterium]|nr:sensor histidine kinase [Chitinophagaceae bacterium]
MQKEKLELLLSVIAASLFILMLMIALVMLFRIYLKRKNKLLLEKELMSAQFEQTLLQSKLEIQEQTFRDIGKELHDNIGQVLSLVRLNLNTLNVEADDEKITSMDNLLDKALADLRNLSHSLDTDYIRKKGWQEPVIRLLQNLKNTGKYAIHAEPGNDLPPLGKEKPIILFRMIQEIIHNIVKHAEADTITMKTQKENDKLVITIQDNGKGFNTESGSDGAGLHNLKNRAKMINADLVITSQPGNGTTVSISIKPNNIE